MAVDLAMTPDQLWAAARADLARTVAAAGFTSVEMLSADLRARPVDELVRRQYETAAPFWR